MTKQPLLAPRDAVEKFPVSRTNSSTGTVGTLDNLAEFDKSQKCTNYDI
ncbi:hypothetical protein EMIT019CA3_30282 [Bacillus pseudomycoides]